MQKFATTAPLPGKLPIGEDRDTLEDVVEPYLIQQGFLQRTPRGRMAAHRAWEHFKLTPPANQGGAVMRDATLF